MTSNSKYSSEEWKIISNIAQLTGLLMSTAAFSGIEGTKNELKAITNSIFQGSKMYPDNLLIHSVIPTGKNDQETLDNIENQQKDIISNTTITDKASLDDFQKSVYHQLKQFIFLTREKENALTVNRFKLWLSKIAESVAIAAIEETVFAKEKDPFCEEEQKVFKNINKILKDLA